MKMQSKPALLRGSAVLLASLGVFIAGVLSFTEFLGTQTPCGESGGCALVATSVYSRLLGIPVAYMGLLAYLALACLPLFGRSRDHGAIRMGFAITAFGVAVSAALLSLSISRLHELCWWCIASGATMAGLLAVYFKLSRSAPVAYPRRLWPIAAASLVCSLAAAWILASRSPQNLADLKQLQEIPYAELVPADAASKGSEAGPVVLVEFGDFACPACRDIYGRLHRLMSDVEGIRLVFRHLPQSHLRHHEASRIGAVDAEIAAESGKFWQFADKAFSLRKPDKEGYHEVLNRIGAGDEPTAAAESRVARDIALAKRLGIQVTPVFVVIVPGRPRTVTTNADLLKRLSDPDIADYIRQRE